MRSYRILGGGIAGQVLRYELRALGLNAFIEDISTFPREKVCGGVLQATSWDYLEKNFSPKIPIVRIFSMRHYWRGRQLSRSRLDRPMVFARRYELDAALDRAYLGPRTPIQTDALVLSAKGAVTASGDWMGFQCEGPPVEELEMHYGRGVYLGMSPTLAGPSHAAFIIRRSWASGWRDVIRRELGVAIPEGPAKATGPIFYGRRVPGLSVGDAKMPTHPFLGLGMKHAIESARLLAQLLKEGSEARYDSEHRKIFRKYETASNWVDFFQKTSVGPAIFNVALRQPIVGAIRHGLHA